MRLPLTVFLSATAVPAAFALAAGVVTVAQQGRAFTSHVLEIARGDAVRFSNEDDFIHQIYVDSSALKYESAEQPPGQAIDVQFPAAGTFEIRCHIHPKMLLTVNVR
jgi:plastocyanin